ncbi:MAG TPA: NAD(P)-dependent oxidoreductase [Pseudonocardia sp.]|uniref:NAD(P)-dependent oxidoreductase n=1 Tax=Pseudonocardia sp. TaxID=60912 RepID=UPI002B4B1C89|nr:NAD(P)-dependent oxidoreductase [Pseudonocardia sp.]HLU57997.1 NAD(P)-dependent oxidoreductase [Pseudonocardia sp.]
MPEVLFGREEFNPGLPWTRLQPLLPGWRIRGCRAAEPAAHVDGADVVCPFGAEVGAEVIARGPFGLIQQYGVGLDRVDVDAATEAGVWVCRLPGDRTGNADSVAELAVLHVLALPRRLDDARSALAAGRWGQPVGRSLLGTTTVLVGLGVIGTAVARRLAGFGTRLVGVRARPELGGPEPVERVVGPDALLDVQAEADVVVCCAMGSPETGNLFDARAFEAVKPGAVFVNVARGSLVDEPALVAALDSGRVCAAGLDVHAAEPADPAGPLLTHPRGAGHPTRRGPHRGDVPAQRRAVHGQPAPVVGRRGAAVGGEPPRGAAPAGAPRLTHRVTGPRGCEADLRSAAS